jgi:hypothetical protein
MVQQDDTITGVTTNSSLAGGNVTATALYAWNPYAPIPLLSAANHSQGHPAECLRPASLRARLH